MILITVLERDHLLSILKECASFAGDYPDGWCMQDQCAGGVEILANLKDTEVEIPDG